MEKVIQIVEGENLKELLKKALEETNYSKIKVESYELSQEEQTIVKGKGKARDILSKEPPMYNYAEYFNFEVNIGTHKNKLVIFDEFEVCIEFEE